MSRTPITPQTLQGNKVSAYAVAESADITFAASTGSAGDSGNSFTSTGNDILIARNDNAAAKTITFTTLEDPYGLQEDISAYSIGIGEYAIFGIFQVVPWRQADGLVYFETNHADIKVAVIAL